MIGVCDAALPKMAPIFDAFLFPMQGGPAVQRTIHRHMDKHISVNPSTSLQGYP